MGKKSVLSAIGLLLALSTMAQTNDFGVWASVDATKDISKKWRVTGELENRTRDNSSQVGRWGAQVGTEYKIWKLVSVGLAYQFQYYHDMKYSDFQSRSRFIGFLQGKYKWNNFSLGLRERFQVTTKDESDRIKSSGKTDTYRINPEWVWRNRLKLDYDIPSSKFTPSFSFESFYQLNNPDGNQFDGLRYTLSLGYNINKQHSIDLSGIYDREINTDEPANRQVLGIGYSFKFK